MICKIFDGENDQAPFLQRISGDYRGKVISFVTNSNKALVRFTSDKSITRTGFTATFHAGSRAGNSRLNVLKTSVSFILYY